MPTRKKVIEDQMTLSLFSSPAQTWAAVLPKDVIPSTFQQTIFGQLSATPRRHLIIRAVAGAGKTWTIVQSAKMLFLTPQADFRVVVASFNVHIKDVLALKLAQLRPGASVTTIHGIGYQCLKRAFGPLVGRADPYKYGRLTRQHLAQWLEENAADEHPDYHPKDRRLLANLIEDVLNMARLTLTDFRNDDGLDMLLAHHSLLLSSTYYPLLRRIMQAAFQELQTRGTHDFTDMLYMPYVLDLMPLAANVVFVDECQDLSPAQLELILKCCKPDGQMIFVGDPDQSIMAFAGASNDSFWRIKKRTDAIMLPLSICYRCPTSHVAIAKQYVPEIEARPDAPEGIVDFVNESDLPDLLAPGDLVLCRTTAPLISWCIKLLRAKVHARVRGIDIADEITRTVRHVSNMPGFRYDHFLTFLARHLDEQADYYAKHQNGQALLSLLMDKMDAIRACHEAFHQETGSVDELCARITELFSDEQSPIMLSTIHRAKGLENATVFILEPHKMPMVWDGQQYWEAEQERNLIYVAVTRATMRLVILKPHNPPDDDYLRHFMPAPEQMGRQGD